MVMKIRTRAEYLDLIRRIEVGYEPGPEEMIEAARFLLCVSAPRRMAQARAEADAREGLAWLRRAGVEIPPVVEAGYGYRMADRARAWFEKAFPLQEEEEVDG